MANDVTRAAELIRQGKLVAFPTETVYGLGCDATNDRAVAAVFEAKGRPQFNPLIVHVRERSAAALIVEFNDPARSLAARFWPGPLTLVLPRADACKVSLLATAGLDTVAIRVPAHPLAQELLAAARVPIAAPSANRSGEVSPTRAEHVTVPADMVLDGGPCRIGLESTVLDLSGERPAILRPGAVTAEEIVALIGPLAPPGTEIRSPGMLARHYATRLPLRLEAREAQPGEAVLGFGPAPDATLNLSPTADLAEAAANLFAMMRALDRPPHTGIAVMPIPRHGLGAAINDRLRRAANSG
jgi:L-threonylcarbamoyladenylate synthase